MRRTRTADTGRGRGACRQRSRPRQSHSKAGRTPCVSANRYTYAVSPMCGQARALESDWSRTNESPFPLSHEVSMRYELLGPLRVSHEGRGSSLSAPKMEMTLATLLVGAGCVTTKDQIIEELWGSGPPRRASAAVHVYLRS